MFAKTRCRAVCVALAFAANAASWNAHAQPASASTKTNAASEPRVEEVELQVGEQRTIPADGVRSYSEGTRGIVDVRLTKDASQFVVVALGEGKSTLLFLMMDGSERHYRFSVVDKNSTRRRGQSVGNVEARDNIRLDFYFVQLTKNYGHQLGLGFPGSIVAPSFAASYNLQAGQLESATAVISNQTLPHLDMAQASGWAKVQRQAAVVTANGERATYSGGGEVNVPIQSALSSGVQKISFGSEIEAEPNYDSQSGRIELRIRADISELDSDHGTGIPGRTTAQLNTIVNLELGQSLILAGLTARSERRSKSGLPGLSQIPLLGVLFGTHSQSEDESENVVIIVPSVVDAVSMEDRRRLDDALHAYEEYSGGLDKVDFIPPAKTARPAAPVPASRP